MSCFLVIRVRGVVVVVKLRFRSGLRVACDCDVNFMAVDARPSLSVFYSVMQFDFEKYDSGVLILQFRTAGLESLAGIFDLLVADSMGEFLCVFCSLTAEGV